MTSALYGAIAQEVSSGINQSAYNTGNNGSFDWSSLIGPVGSFAVGAINSRNAKKAAERQYERQIELMNLQYQLNQRALREGPSNYRKGLTDAGYNPILPFASSGSSAMQGGSVGLGSATAEQPALLDMNAVNSSQMLRYQQRQIDSQIENVNANTTLNREQALTEMSKRENYDFQNAMLDVEKHLKEKDLSHYEEKFYQDIYESMQRAENYRAQASVAEYDAQSRRIMAESSVTNAQANYLSSTEGNGFKVLQSYLRAFGITPDNVSKFMSSDKGKKLIKVLKKI